MEKGKIEAYTLMEVAVAMLIAAICISICYTAYGLIGNYFIAFQKKNDSAQNILSLRRAMDRDIQRSGYLIRIDDGMEVRCDSLTIRYHFHQSALNREVDGLRTDSFSVAPIETSFRFEGRETVTGDTVDRVGLVLSLEKGEKIPMVFKKKYSAQDLFR